MGNNVLTNNHGSYHQREKSRMPHSEPKRVRKPKQENNNEMTTYHLQVHPFLGFLIYGLWWCLDGEPAVKVIMTIGLIIASTSFVKEDK